MRRSPNELHLYISEAKSFLSVYCATVSVHLLLHSWLLQWFPMGPTLLKGAPSNNGSLGPPESVPQTASGSFFLHSSRYNVPILHNGPPFFPKIAPYSWGISTPIEFMVPTESPNVISIGSAVFAGLKNVTNRQTPNRQTHRHTDRPRDSMWSNRPQSLAAMRPNNNNNNNIHSSVAP